MWCAKAISLLRMSKVIRQKVTSQRTSTERAQNIDVNSDFEYYCDISVLFYWHLFNSLTAQTPVIEVALANWVIMNVHRENIFKL